MGIDTRGRHGQGVQGYRCQLSSSLFSSREVSCACGMKVCVCVNAKQSGIGAEGGGGLERLGVE